MPSKGKKHVALIGAGYWGKNLLRVFDQLDVLDTICDIDRALLAERKKAYPHLSITPQISTILKNRNITSIAIATPAKTHYAVAKNALKAGKDVFVEKPLALNVSEGEELVALAREKKRVLMVGHVLSYHPAVTALKTLVEKNTIGNIHHIYSNRLNLGKIRTEENVLWSFAPHDISIILDLMGMPFQVRSIGKSYLQEKIHDTTISFFEFENGKAAHIFVSWLNPFKEQRLSIIAQKAMVVFNDQAEDKLIKYNHFLNGSETVKGIGEAIPIPSEEPLRNEVMHFLHCIRTRNTPKTDGREALAVLKVLNACQESLDQDGKIISISL